VDTICSRIEPSRRDDALLAVTELVTNSLQHTGGPLAVLWSADGEHLVFEVVDGGPRGVAPCPGSGFDPDEHGRGLVIVRALADEVARGRRGEVHWVRAVFRMGAGSSAGVVA